MNQNFFNLQQFAPILEKDQELDKSEFLRQLGKTLDPKKGTSRAILSVISGLEFFRIIKDRLGRVTFS